MGACPQMENLWPQLVSLLQVLIIDLVLAGDNAIVVGLAVKGAVAYVGTKGLGEAAVRYFEMRE